MFFTFEKIQKRTQELEQYRYVSRRPIAGLKFKPDNTKSEKYPPKIDGSWNDIVIGSFYEGRDSYFWVQGELDLPYIPEGEEIVLLFDFGKTGSGHNFGFESLLYVDGVPFQGVGSNHKEAFLPHGYGNKKAQIALRLWTGLEGGGKRAISRHQFKYADYAFVSKETDDLYYTSNMMLGAVKILDENSPERYGMLKLLDGAFAKVDWAEPGSMSFYESVRAANETLQKSLVDMRKSTPVNITAIGHTHIDVAWLWTLAHTREKCARSFSTVLKLMERYPEYIFLQSQPQLYAYVKEDHPEIFEKIKQKIDEGSWEVGGAMWVEADCNIPSGESLVRQILYGTRFIEREFGKNVKYLWLPDVFGYSWALPQILKKSGIDTFMTTKISWNQYNRMPHDTFWWRGMDGSEVLAHFITTPGMEDEHALYTYNGEINPTTVAGIYSAYQNKDFNSELLLSYGFGDGGGGANRDMLENIRRIDKIPGLPNIKNGRADEFFERLHKTVNETDRYVHTWDGELYLEYHRGTYTSQAFVKKHNRRLEIMLRETEMLYVMAMAFGKNVDYPQSELCKAWEIVLRNQFHDIIPGSSIREVYEDAALEYEQADKIVGKLIAGAHELFDEDEDTWSCFNSAGWMIDHVLAFVPEKRRGSFVDASGKQLESTAISSGYMVKIDDIPACGGKAIKFVDSIKQAEENTATLLPGGIETRHFRVSWNTGGQLEEIFDKENGRQVLGGLGNCLVLHEDKPINFDAWDIDLFYTQKSMPLAAHKIEIKCNTPLFASVGFEYSFGKSSLMQEMVVYKHSRRIDFKTKANWQERQRLLRANFDVNIRGTEAVYDIQFGNVKRPTHWNTSWDLAKFETVAHFWVDFSERDYGVALLNDCKYGHSVKDSTMGISLIKGAIYPDLEADIGEHEFTYSLLPHMGDFIQGGVANEAWKLNNPPIMYKRNMSTPSLLEIDSKYPVMIDAIKKHEDNDGTIVRMHDHTGSTRNVKITPAFEYSFWQKTDLMERPSGTKKYGKNILVELEPYEILTLLIA